MDIRGLSGPISGSEDASGSTEQDREAIRRQLSALLASPVLKRSKGCSNLLQYIVRQTLDGDPTQLKERTLGVEVFGRAPDYDTASDHVVRSTVSEVRKRLAQYYTEPGRSDEIRIDVPLGSYVPRFVFPEDHSAATLADVAPVIAGTSPRARSRYYLAALLLPLAGIAVFSMLAMTGEIGRSSTRALNRFWQPVLQSPAEILMCIGNSKPAGEASHAGTPETAGIAQPDATQAGAFRGSDRVFMNDAIVLARFAGWLQQNGKHYRIVAHSKVTFSDLQSNPAVLIGFLSNYWTQSLAGRLRFTVERGLAPHTLVMRDKKNPANNDWSVDLSTPYDQTTKDYALVVRELDPKTDQMVIAAAGITHFGTLAAGEFLTNPSQIEKLDAYGPPGWGHKNVAIVLSTEVIKGSPGPPKIVATDFW